MKPKPVIICVVGPTAIGKTSLSIALAQAFSTEIISADSRQFYKEMSIGTAVPTMEELAAVPHHFIQNRSIFEDYSVGDYERDALDFINKRFFPSDSRENSLKTIIMVGGSGLYIDAVIKGLDEFPHVPQENRERLNKELEDFGLIHLQNKLKKADPEHFAKVDLHNPHRLIRALEIVEYSGKPYTSFLNKKSENRNFKTILIGLTAEREIVYDRINRRVDNMMKEGLMEEAKALYSYRDKNALQTVGYRELFEYFNGKISEEEAVNEIKKNSRRYAKRQGTWFRKNDNIHWFPYDTDHKTIIQFIKEKNALK